MADPDNEFMIEATLLWKQYGRLAAIEDVSFAVPRGQIAALAGPNGAGKSTTLKVLAGSVPPTQGSARIGGFDVALDRIEVLQRVGYLPEECPLYPEMTPVGLLNYAGEVRGLDATYLSQRLEYVAETCQLKGVWETRIGALPADLQRRVGMAQALLHDPQVLLLDEPTSGLEPAEAADMLKMIVSLRPTRTILFSTYELKGVLAVVDRLLLMLDGRIDGPYGPDGNEIPSER